MHLSFETQDNNGDGGQNFHQLSTFADIKKQEYARYELLNRNYSLRLQISPWYQPQLIESWEAFILIFSPGK